MIQSPAGPGGARPPVRTIDTHTAGEPTRIVLDGDELLTGPTVWITHRAGSRNPGLIFAEPVSQPFKVRQ